MRGVAEGWSREGSGGEGWMCASDEAEGWVAGWASGERREAPYITVDPWRLRQRDDGGLSGESFADGREERCDGDGHTASRHDWVRARVRDQPGEAGAHLSHTCAHEPAGGMAAKIGEHETNPIVVNDDWDESALAEIDSVERAALAGPLLPPQQQPSERHSPHEGQTLAHSFDARQIQTWEYPESSTFPVRKYQFDIAAVAVRHNTLVSLPTGLGKTLIAAVVIHNLLRWFPAGRAVFIAPTKPLVHQQIRAVRHVLGLQAADVVELTGSTVQMAREELWRRKRIIFATPQALQPYEPVLMNDLKNGTCPGEEVVCLVVDEAHKAVGNAAVKQAVDLLFRKGGGCRILGLSATPGPNTQMIQQVVRNLRISRLEARDEASVDVVGCFHQRATRICKCDLPDEYLAARDAVGRQYAHWLRRLRAVGMVYDSDPNKVTKFTLVQLQQKLNTEPPDPARMAAHKAFLHSAEFSMAIMMASAYEQIVCYGSGACLAYLQQQEKVPTDKEGGCKRKGQLVRRLKRDFFEGAAFVEMLALVQRCAKGISHPKIVLTAQLLHEHFEERQHAGRAIVFTSYRNAVDELLERLESVEGVKASAFIGQNKGKGDGGSAKGMPQKEQRACLKHFTSGTFNVLVATTIGEEGLDIGEVDLIIQFDAIVSPIRTTQRSGRTGRKRDGEVIMLMTPGYEEAVYERAQSKHTAMRRAIQSTGFDFFKPQSALVPIGGLQVVRRDFQAELCNPTPTAAPPSIKRGAKGGAAVSANKQTRQDPALVARVLELGRAGKGLRDIDAQLHADGFLNSKGKVMQPALRVWAGEDIGRRTAAMPIRRITLA
ncbi:hypothetical protein AB1Y20_020600 [Prymnesium parvum]|uniref:ATP-dependent DNA helicase n=1 Tax=Prymnesium parvum TaxID=97485 RepID=A0AB34JXD2_PRYPA